MLNNPNQRQAATTAKSDVAEIGKPAVPPAPTGLQEVLSFFKTLAIIVVLIVFIRGTIVCPYRIPSESMVPTLKVHDHIFVSNLSYGIRLPFVQDILYQYAHPKRFDIVVFTRPDDPKTPDDDSNTNIIKRVVGLPGDLVEVRGTKVYINNMQLSEPHARWQFGGIIDGYFGPARVPPGHVFLLGDNRDNSRDSRFWSEPFLPEERIKGRALFIYWTWGAEFFDRIGKVIR